MRLYERVSLPVNRSLNGTIPALVNISVGSFCGTSDALAQTSWPRVRKKSRNAARIWEEVWLMGRLAI